MRSNIYFTNEEVEILAKLLVLSVREVIVADGEISDDEFAPFSYSISNAHNFPIPIVFSSSCATYGIPKKFPINEDTKQFPRNPYGKSKLFVEEMIKDLGKAKNLKSVILRYFNAAGAMPDSSMGEMHEPETHLIPLVIQTALGLRENISIYGNDYDTFDGTPIRDFIHVSDIAEIHFLVLEKINRLNISKILNCGYNKGTSVLEVAKEFKRQSSKKIDIVYVKRRKNDLIKNIMI